MVKRWVLCIVIMAGLSACSDEGKIEVDIDSAGKKLDTTAERLYDTAKKKMQQLTDKIEDRVNRKDTLENN